MGQFSWMTQDTGMQIGSEPRNTIVVHMFDDDGNTWTEKNYKGYGVFGGKDYFELVAEMNGYNKNNFKEFKVKKGWGSGSEPDELRNVGIMIDAQINDGHAPVGTYKFPGLVRYESSIDFQDHDFSQAPQDDPNQSWYNDDYAKGGYVNNNMKNYIYTVDSVDVNWVEDNYERGEVSSVVAFKFSTTPSAEPLGKSFKYQTEDIYSLLDFLDEYIDGRSDYGRGHLQANSTILVDDENNVSNFRIYLTLLAPTAGSDAQPTTSEIEAWRKGEINLYNRNVDIRVSITQDASLTVKEISDKLGILVYSKGGELMDADTEFEYSRGGRTNLKIVFLDRDPRIPLEDKYISPLKVIKSYDSDSPEDDYDVLIGKEKDFISFFEDYAIQEGMYQMDDYDKDDYAKGGELMDADTEFEYNRGGDVNDDLDQLEEASDMVNTAANLVEDVVPPSLMSNYRAYGRYGFDQLLGKGNPYDKGLDDISEAIEESYNYEEGEEYAKGGDLSELKDEDDDIFIVNKIDDKTYDIAVNSNYIYWEQQEEGEYDDDDDYPDEKSDFEIIDEWINDYWFKGSKDNNVISIDESSYDKEIEGHDIYRIVLKNKLNSKSKNTKTVREIVHDEVGSTVIDRQQPGEAEVQYFVSYIVGTIFRILDDLKLIDKKNIERAKALQMRMMDRTPMYLQEHVNCDELNIYAHREYAAKFYSYDLLNSNLIKSENRERVEEVIFAVLQETNFYPCGTEELDYAKGGDIDRDYKMINVGRSSVFTSGFKIYPEALKVGKIYEWTVGAQPLYVRYLGLSKDLNIKSSSSIGSDKYKFQFVGPFKDDKYIGLSGSAVRQGHVVQVKNVEELIKEETLSEIKDYEKAIRKAKREKDKYQVDRLTKQLNEYKSFYKSIDKLNKYAKGGKIGVGSVVANKKHKTIGIVRDYSERYSEARTDADGNVNISDLEPYNVKKHKDYHIAPSTKDEIESAEMEYAKGGKIDIVDERSVGKMKIIVMNDGKSSRTITFKDGVENKFNRNKQEDINKLWELSSKVTFGKIVDKNYKFAKGGRLTKATISYMGDQLAGEIDDYIDLTELATNILYDNDNGVYSSAEEEDVERMDDQYEDVKIIIGDALNKLSFQYDRGDYAKGGELSALLDKKGITRSEWASMSADERRKIVGKKNYKRAKPYAKGGNIEDWLFIGKYPTGTTYSDKTKSKYGDYKQIAYVFDEPQEDWNGAKYTKYRLKIYSNDKKYQPLIKRLQKEYGTGVKYYARGGNISQVSKVGDPDYPNYQL